MALPPLKATVTLDKAKFQRGLRKVRAAARNFGARITRMGAAVARSAAIIGAALTAAAVAGVAFATKLGDALSKMSDRTGMTVENLSALQHAANLSDTDLSTLGKAMKSLAVNMNNANAGLATSVRMFTDLGLNFKELQSMSPDEQFDAVAKAIAKIEDPTERAGKAIALLGRAGQKLLPMLNKGAEGLEAMKKEAERLGLIVDADQAKSAAKLADEFTRITAQLKVMLINTVPFDLIRSGLASLTKALNDFRSSDHFGTMKKSISDFVRSAIDKIWTMANTVYKLIQVWGLLDAEIKGRLKAILAATAAFAAAWASGFLGLFTATIGAVIKMFAGVLVPAVAAALTALAGLIVGFKIGEALEKTFDISGIIAKWDNSLAAAYDIFKNAGTVLSDLAAAAIMRFASSAMSAVDIFKNAGGVLVDLAGAVWAGVESALSGKGFDTDPFKQILDDGAKAQDKIIDDWENAPDLFAGIIKDGAAAQNAIIDGWQNAAAEIDEMSNANGKGLVDNLTAEFGKIPKELSKTLAGAGEKLKEMTGVSDIGAAFKAAFDKAKDLPKIEFGDLDPLAKAKDDANEIVRNIRGLTSTFRGMDRVFEKQLKAAKAGAVGKGGLGRFAAEGAKKLFGPEALAAKGAAALGKSTNRVGVKEQVATNKKLAEQIAIQKQTLRFQQVIADNTKNSGSWG